MKTRWKHGQNINKHGENIGKHGENIVSFIQNHFVNNLYEIQFCISLNDYATSTLIDKVPIITISYFFW